MRLRQQRLPVRDPPRSCISWVKRSTERWYRSAAVSATLQSSLFCKNSARKESRKLESARLIDMNSWQNCSKNPRTTSDLAACSIRMDWKGCILSGAGAGGMSPTVPSSKSVASWMFGAWPTSQFWTRKLQAILLRGTSLRLLGTGPQEGSLDPAPT